MYHQQQKHEHTDYNSATQVQKIINKKSTVAYQKITKTIVVQFVSAVYELLHAHIQNSVWVKE